MDFDEAFRDHNGYLDLNLFYFDILKASVEKIPLFMGSDEQ